MRTGVKTFLGLDVGTTSLKAAVFDENGKRLGFRVVDYTLDADPEKGYLEFDAESYIEMCKRVIAELGDECGAPDAISVDTQGETMILSDGEGKPLCPAVVWLDNRAEAEAEEIKSVFGNKRVYEVTGQPEITAGWPACKLLWFKRNRPEIWAKLRRVFLLEDWILYRLSGEFVTEPTIQSSSVYFDITKRDWWDEMLDYIGLPHECLPKVLPSMTVCGDYNGIPVVTGALDQIAGTVGCGVVDESGVSEMTGTIMAICAMTDKIPPYDPASIIPCHLHAMDGKYCLILWSSTAGMALKWFKNTFASDKSFRELDELAEKIPAGSDGLSVLPYFTGSTMPKYNPSARAVFSGVTLAHTTGHFARAIMESIAFLLREDLEYIGRTDVSEIRITGGGASSPLWAQIKADVTGHTLRTVSESETACLGCAVFAAVGIGAFPSVKEAASRLVSPKDVYKPSGADYTEAYRRFASLDEQLNQIPKE